jgi:hypothetical protein
LNRAANNGHLEMVLTLLQFGADKNKAGYNGEKPADIGKTDEIKMILKGNFSLLHFLLLLSPNISLFSYSRSDSSLSLDERKRSS